MLLLGVSNATEQVEARGGVVARDENGQAAAPSFTTPGRPRGWPEIPIGDVARLRWTEDAHRLTTLAKELDRDRCFPLLRR